MSDYKIAIDGVHGSRTYKIVPQLQGLNLQIDTKRGTLGVVVLYNKVTDLDEYRIVELDKTDGEVQSLVAEGIVGKKHDAIDDLNTADRAKLAALLSSKKIIVHDPHTGTTSIL